MASFGEAEKIVASAILGANYLGMILLSIGSEIGKEKRRRSFSEKERTNANTYKVKFHCGTGFYFFIGQHSTQSL